MRRSIARFAVGRFSFRLPKNLLGIDGELSEVQRDYALLGARQNLFKQLFPEGSHVFRGPMMPFPSDGKLVYEITERPGDVPVTVTASYQTGPHDDSWLELEEESIQQVAHNTFKSLTKLDNRIAHDPSDIAALSERARLYVRQASFSKDSSEKYSFLSAALSDCQRIKTLEVDDNALDIQINQLKQAIQELDLELDSVPRFV